MATSTGQRWIIGCSIGCGAVLLLLGLMATGTCFMVRDFVEDFSKVEESNEALVSAFGEHEDYTPAADGSIPEDRLRTFLAARRELEPNRAALHELFDGFPPDEDAGFWTAFKVVRGLAGMIDDIVAFIDARNRVLLANGMGEGEYLYLYSVVFYSWLGHDPGDGPMHDGERIFDGDDSTFGVDESFRNYRRFMLAVLRNQLDSLTEESDEAWRSELLAEIDKLERERQRVAWSDGLPQALEASLEPLRLELEAAYDAETNCFELPTAGIEGEGGFHWRVD